MSVFVCIVPYPQARSEPMNVLYCIGRNKFNFLGMNDYRSVHYENGEL